MVPRMGDRNNDGDRKRPLQGLGRALLGAGLPLLGHAAGGPLGGMVAARAARALGLGGGADAIDEIEARLAEADPATLAELRRIEADLAAAELAAFETEARELTARLAVDSAGDSWLARNIRPLSLAVCLSGYLAFIFAASFALEKAAAAVAVSFGQQLQALLFAMVGFYFGSRGVEKVMGSKPKGGAR